VSYIVLLCLCDDRIMWVLYGSKCCHRCWCRCIGVRRRAQENFGSFWKLLKKNGFLLCLIFLLFLWFKRIVTVTFIDVFGICEVLFEW